MAWLRIDAITCIETQEPVSDEIYMVVRLDGGEPELNWGPHDMKQGDSLEINWSSQREFYDEALVQIWEQDAPRDSQRRDDQIANWRIPAFSWEGQDAIVGYEGGVYRVAYSVSEQSTGLLRWPVRLLRMHCNDAKGTRDDVYLLWNGRLIWGPTRMRTGDTQPIDRVITVGEIGTLSLWEQDRIQSDRLDHVNLYAQQESLPEPGEQTVQFHWHRTDRRDALYTLYYEG